jgi:hypothetical protein
VIIKTLQEIFYETNKERLDALAVFRVVAFVNYWWVIGQNKVRSSCASGVCFVYL